MVRNMNFSDPDKPNGEELSIDEGNFLKMLKIAVISSNNNYRLC